MKHIYIRLLFFIFFDFFVGWGVVAQSSDIHVFLNVKHSVGEFSKFDRKKFINLHASLTEGDWEGEEDKMEYILNDLNVFLGRDNGSMGWYINQASENPVKAGFVDPNYMISMGKYVRETVYGTNHVDKHKYEEHSDMLIGGQVNPFWFGHKTSPYDGGDGWEIGGPEAVGDYMGQFLNYFFRNEDEPPTKGKKRPRFIEILNEPLYDLVTNGNHTPLEVFLFHNEVADAIRKHNSDILIGGYTTAFPFFDEDNFQRWNNRMKLFYDVSGDKMDFFSIHLYDFNKHHLNDGDPSSFDGPIHFKGSRLEATLDLMEQYSQLKWGKVKPILISEFGGRDHSTEWKPWTPERDWHFMKAFSPMLLSFMERPNIILKAIPFIVNKGEWGRTNVPYPWRLMRQSFEADGESGDDWVFTEMIKFYELWSDVEGTRISVNSANPDILADGYVLGNKAYLIVSNLNLNPENILFKLFENRGNKLNSIKVKHLHFEGSSPKLQHQDLPLSEYVSFTLDTEASAIFELTFENEIILDESLDETKYYADKYLHPIIANSPLTFNINGVNLGVYNSAVLRVGFGREHGKSKEPTVVFNGVELNVPANFAGDDSQSLRNQFFGLLQIPVSDSVLNENNIIEIRFPDEGGFVSSVTMRVFNSTLKLEQPDNINLKVKNTLNSEIKIFPNPSNGMFRLVVPEDFFNAKICIYNTEGKKLYQSIVNAFQELISFGPVPPGTYLLSLEKEESNHRFKIMIRN